MPKTATETGLLTRLVSGQPAIDIEKRTIRFSFSSSFPVERFAWFDENLPEEASYIFDEVLSHDASHWRLDRVNNGVVPYLRNHDRDQKLGKILSVEFDGNRAYATAKLRRTQDADQHLADLSDGMGGGVSFGYRVHKYRVVSPAEYEGDRWDRRIAKKAVLEAIDIELIEISDEATPADPSVGYGRSIDFRSVAVDGNPNFTPAEQPMPPTDNSELEQVRSQLSTVQTELATLRSLIQEKDNEINQRDQRIAQLERGQQVGDRYNALRRQAEQLRSEFKLTPAEFDGLFAADAATDLSRFTGDANSETELGNIDFYLRMIGNRPPMRRSHTDLQNEPLPAPEGSPPPANDEEAQRLVKTASAQRTVI